MKLAPILGLYGHLTQKEKKRKEVNPLAPGGEERIFHFSRRKSKPITINVLDN